MTDLAAWLLEQIAEDEVAARAAMHRPRNLPPFTGKWAFMHEDLVMVDDGLVVAPKVWIPAIDHLGRWDPARVLAECAARRALVELHALHDPPPDPSGPGGWPMVCTICEDRRLHDAEQWPCPTLRLLAQPYVDRAGFDPSWRLEHTG